MSVKPTFAENAAKLGESLDKAGKNMQKAGNQSMATGCGCMLAMAIIFLPIIIILSMF